MMSLTTDTTPPKYSERCIVRLEFQIFVLYLLYDIVTSNDVMAVDYLSIAEWRRIMRISYDKLWILMKKNKLNKGELATAAEISGYTMGKLYRDEPVSLEVMMRICKVFHCNIGDVVEMIENDN